MASMVCNRCGCEFAVGVRMCPQCTSESARMKGDEDMAKISVHGGPTDVDREADAWDGTKLSASSEKEPTTEPDSSPSDQSPAPTTENLSSPDPEESSTAPSTDGSGAADPYDSWSKDELQAELVERELPKSGNVPELVARLREDDAKE